MCFSFKTWSCQMDAQAIEHVRHWRGQTGSAKLRFTRGDEQRNEPTVSQHAATGIAASRKDFNAISLNAHLVPHKSFTVGVLNPSLKISRNDLALRASG